MSVKSEVSAHYLQLQMERHGAKKTELHARAMMTGIGKRGSIGEAIANALVEDGCDVYSYPYDVRETIRLLEPAVRSNALILCHGVTRLDWFEDAPVEKLREIVDVNLTSTIALTQAFVKVTIDKPYRKTIIAIGSMAYKAVLNGSAAYCASKAGLAHFIRCLAWELAPKGFDCYCIHPSNTLDTPMSEETIEGLMRYRGLSRSDAEAYWNDSQIRESSLTKAEIVRLVMHLLNGNNPYLSGCQLELAGGQR